MIPIRLFILLAAFAVTAVQPVTAAAQVGQVTRIEALAQVLRTGPATPLAVTSPVHMNDIVTTGREARLEITFNDGTVLTLGENARLQIDRFVFQPTTRDSGVDLAIKGAFRFVTGQLSARDGLQVRTPVAIIGIRGTDFFAGPVNGIYGVLLFDGNVAVTNPQGETVLERPGQGTTIDAPGEAPGPATVWSQENMSIAPWQSVAFP